MAPNFIVATLLVLNSDDTIRSSKNTRLLVLAINSKLLSKNIGGAVIKSGVTEIANAEEQDASANVRFALDSAKVEADAKNKNAASLIIVAEQDMVLTICMAGMLSPPTPSIKYVVASQLRVIVPENVEVVDALVGTMVLLGALLVRKNLKAVPKESVTLSTLGVSNNRPLPLTTRLL